MTTWSKGGPEKSAHWKERARQLQDTGMPLRAIAREVGVSNTALRKQLVPRSFMGSNPD